MIMPRIHSWLRSGPKTARSAAETQAAYNFVIRATHEGLHEIQAIRAQLEAKPLKAADSLQRLRTPWKEISDQLARLHQRTGDPMISRAQRACARAAEHLEYAAIAAGFRDFSSTFIDLHRAESSVTSAVEALAKVMALEYRPRLSHRPLKVATDDSYLNPAYVSFAVIDTTDVASYLS